jgi:starch synthase
MYSLCYGTIPVVHATGGLDDSLIGVPEYRIREPVSSSTKYEPEAIIEAIKSALQLFRGSRKWIGIH